MTSEVTGTQFGTPGKRLRCSEEPAKVASAGELRVERTGSALPDEASPTGRLLVDGRRNFPKPAREHARTAE